MPRKPKPELPPLELVSELIEPDRFYTLLELQQLLGIQPSSWNISYRDGLSYGIANRRVAIRGRSFLHFAIGQADKAKRDGKNAG
jgi:hypothetical protein